MGTCPLVLSTIVDLERPSGREGGFFLGVNPPFHKKCTNISISCPRLLADVDCKRDCAAAIYPLLFDLSVDQPKWH